MKSIKLALLSLVTLIAGSAYGYTWQVTNTTSGTVKVTILRKGTLRSDDNKKAITLDAGQSASYNLGGAYCANGVLANGLSGAISGKVAQKSFNLICSSRTVYINHVGQQYTNPSAGGVTVVTGGTLTGATTQPTLIPGSGTLEIIVQ